VPVPGGLYRLGDGGERVVALESLLIGLGENPARLLGIDVEAKKTEVGVA
jgi:hypothetical protein